MIVAGHDCLDGTVARRDAGQGIEVPAALAGRHAWMMCEEHCPEGSPGSKNVVEPVNLRNSDLTPDFVRVGSGVEKDEAVWRLFHDSRDFRRILTAPTGQCPEEIASVIVVSHSERERSGRRHRAQNGEEPPVVPGFAPGHKPDRR